MRILLVFGDIALGKAIGRLLDKMEFVSTIKHLVYWKDKVDDIDIFDVAIGQVFLNHEDKQDFEKFAHMFRKPILALHTRYDDHDASEISVMLKTIGATEVTEMPFNCDEFYQTIIFLRDRTKIA